MSFEYNTRFSSPISITENGVMTPNGILGYDKPRTAAEHHDAFTGIGGAKIVLIAEKNNDDNKLVLECGVNSGLVVIQIGTNRGSFVPKLDPGSYGVEHTNLGNLVTKTKQIIDVNNGTCHLIFGIVPSQWPDGLHTCTLVQPDLKGRRVINLLGDGSIQPIEPTSGFRFYTPFYHIPGAGSAYSSPNSNVYPLYRLGIMTLNREQLSELLRAFNRDWSNGPVFARNSKSGGGPLSNDDDVLPKKKTNRWKRKKKEGLDKWF